MYRRKRSAAIRVGKMPVVFDRGPGRPARIPVPAADGEGCAPALFGRRSALVMGEMFGDAAPDSLRHRDPEPACPALEPAVLFDRELYLSTHHDGIVIPS